MMNNNIDFDIIKRYCEDNFDKKDISYIYSLFSENEKEKIFQQYIKDDFFTYLKNDTVKRKNLSRVLGRIHHKIHIDERRKKHSTINFIYKWYSAIAAILLIPLLVAGYIWITANKSEQLVAEDEFVTSTIHAPLGSRINFTLPDGTVGWLNSGSSLTYNIPFNTNRNVSILGEVWFDVIKNGQHPFEVNTGTSKIEVLGTKFNISAYPEEKYVEVVLEEGKVKFSRF
jgi:transmembrane sensor